LEATTHNPAETVTRRLPASVFAYVAIALAGLVVWPTLATLARYWRDIYDYRHGFLIAATCVGWLWVLRRRLDAQRIEPQCWVAIPLTGALFAWLLAFVANSEMGQQLLLPPLLLLSVWLAAGRAVAMLTAGPLLFLYFGIPVWDYAIPVLRALTVAVCGHTLALMGVPAIINDFSVTIPEGVFQVVEGCAGTRYLVTALALAYAACAVNRFSLGRCAWFIPAAGLLSLVANWIRVDIIIYAGHATNMQSHLVAVEHLTLGTGIFVVLIAAMIGASLWLPVEHQPPAPPVATGEPIALNARTLRGVAVAAVLMTAVATVAFAGTMGVSDQPKLGALPVTFDAWQGPLPAAREWTPAFKGAADEARAAYRLTQGAVEVYVNVYGRQSPGSELIHYGNSLVTAEGWELVDAEPAHAHGNAERSELAFEQAETSEHERWVVAHVYVVGSHVTASPTIAQLAYGATALMGWRPAGVIAFASRCEADCEPAHARIASFWGTHGSSIRALIPKTTPGESNVGPTTADTRDGRK
jgi:EpsI family protein